MKEINPGSLSKLLARTTYTSVVGVKPTGWTHTQNTNLTGEESTRNKKLFLRKTRTENFLVDKAD